MTTDARVFIVDDDPSVRRSLDRLMRSAGYATEVFGSAAEFLDRPPYDGDCCLLLDLRMPSLTGADLQDRLVAEGRHLPIVFLTGHGDVPDSVKAVKQGAVDFLIKPVSDEVLLAVVAEALARYRETHAEHEQLARLRQRIATLTAREFEVMRYVIAGVLNKQTAGHLGIAETTIKVHRARVMEKMGVQSVPELVRLCDAAGVARIDAP